MKKENNDFAVDVTEEKGCHLTLKVDVKPSQVKKAYKEAVKTINKEVSIPGFRKGKAPDDAIIKQYGVHIEKEWKENVINFAFSGALELIQIYPYTKKSIEKAKIEKCDLESGAVVILAYERYPEVPDVDFSKLSLPKIDKKPIEESEIQTVLQEIQKGHAAFEEVTGRSVQEGDFIDVSIDKIDEDPPHNLVKERRFEVSDLMLPWLKNLVLGQNVGASVEGQTEPDPKADEKVKAGFQPIKVRIDIHGIKKSVLPAVDDELAKKAGAESKDDLLAKIRNNLDKDAEFIQREEQIRSLEEALLKNYSFEIPASLLQNEISERTKEKVNRLKEQGVSDESINEEELRKEVGKDAEGALRLHFLFNRIGEKEKVTLTQDELSQKVTNEIMSNPYYMTIQKQDSELFGKIINRLSTRFLFDKIREHALNLASGNPSLKNS